MATLTNITSIFASQVLNMDTFSVTLLYLEVPVLSTIGNYTFYKIFRKYNLSSKTILITGLAIISFTPLYAIIGLANNISFGLKSQTEMFIVAGIYGFCEGTVYSYSRSMFALLVPTDMEAEFFGFYEVTDKGSSWIGTLLAAFITNSTDNLRLINIYILLALWLAIPAVWKINITEGIDQAKDFKKIINQ